MDYNLHTGDLILFSGEEIESEMIQMGTDSKYTHVAMVAVVDELHQLNGLKPNTYLLETIAYQYDIKDEEREKTGTHGVQLTLAKDRFANYHGNIYCRKLDINRDRAFWEKFNHIYDLIRGTPFNENPGDWILTGFFPELHRQNTPDKFFCSALMGFMFVNLGIFHSYYNWSNLRPKDFGEEVGNRFPIMKKGYLGQTQIIQLGAKKTRPKLLCPCVIM
jgi:hypothetical protein